MTSPHIIHWADEPSGRLRGKEAVGAYWGAALRRFPELRFELLAVLNGVNCVTVSYRGLGGILVAEVFFRPRW